MTEDPVFTRILNTPALASQPSLSRFCERFDANSITQLQQGNQELLDKVHHRRQSTAIIFDLDSTHADLMVTKNLFLKELFLITYSTITAEQFAHIHLCRYQVQTLQEYLRNQELHNLLACLLLQ